MGSLRAGNVFGAISQGLGLFAERSARSEAEALDKEWQLTLANMRERQASDRQKEGFEHSEQLARDSDASAERRQKESQTAANERHRTDVEATAKFREESMTADERRNEQKRVDDARQNLQSTLLSLEKEQAKELEAQGFNPEQQNVIMERYSGLKDDAIIGTVSWLSSQNLPGYGVADEKGLTSLLVQNGMDIAGANEHGKNVWSQIAPPQPKPESVGVSQEAVARGGRASSHADFLTDPGLIPMIDDARGGGTTGAAATPQQAVPEPQDNQLFQMSGDYQMPTGTGGPQITPPGSGPQMPSFPRNEGGNVNPLELGRGIFDSFAGSPFFNEEARNRNAETAQQYVDRLRRPSGR